MINIVRMQALDKFGYNLASIFSALRQRFAIISKGSYEGNAFCCKPSSCFVRVLRTSRVCSYFSNSGLFLIFIYFVTKPIMTARLEAALEPSVLLFFYYPVTFIATFPDLRGTWTICYSEIRRVLRSHSKNPGRERWSEGHRAYLETLRCSSRRGQKCWFRQRGTFWFVTPRYPLL